MTTVEMMARLRGAYNELSRRIDSYETVRRLDNRRFEDRINALTRRVAALDGGSEHRP